MNDQKDNSMLNKASNILNAASNLLGFCLVVITGLKISNYNKDSHIDEFTGIAALMLVIAIIFSFLSIRSTNELRIPKFERVAEISFLISLIIILGITFFIAFTVY